MLKVEKIRKKFGKKMILHDISLTFNRGSVYVIVGANGSGKTTFMNVINNLLEADNGKILLDQYSGNSKKYKESVFYLPSDFYLPEYLTGQEYLGFVLERYPKANKKIANELIDILSMKNSQKNTIESYSFGMKKKIQLIAAISSGTDYIFADEAFSGLDFETVILIQDIFEIISKNKGIILVSHDLNTLMKFNKNIYIMQEGKIVLNDLKPIDIVEKIKKEGKLKEKVENIERYLISD